MTTKGGILAAMLTPFDEQGGMATQNIPPLVDYILSTGVDGLYAGGSSGECILQSCDERAEVLRALAAYARGKCKLVAHVGSAATGDAVKLAQLSGQLGYDAVSAIPPFYYPHDADSITDYYRAIADHARLPLIIYNIPALTGVDLGTSGLLALLQDDRISGVKFTAPDLFQFWRLREAAPDKQFYFGTDEMFLAACATGADGGIGSTYNLIGDVYTGIENAVERGDISTARLLQAKSNELVTLLLQTGVLPGLKHSLNRLGVPVGACRKPFRPPSRQSLQALDAWMDANLGVGRFGAAVQPVQQA